jgi:TolB protein
LQKNVFFFLCLFLLALVCLSSSKSNDYDGKIAFVANIDGNWDIFVMDLNGGVPTRLTETPFDERTPDFSPDGKSIVYSATDGKIRIINVNTKEIQEIKASTSESLDIHPEFSPTGDKIVFVSYIDKKIDETDLSIYDIKTGESEPFFVERSSQFFPSWSPNGKYIAYSNTHCSISSDRIIEEIWITSTDQRWARQLALTSSMCIQPSWSPDGKKIAFCSDKSGNFDIWFFNIDSQTLTQLTTDPSADMDPVWSPDGDHILFMSNKTGAMELWTMKSDGQELHKLTPFGDKKIQCKDPSWR